MHATRKDVDELRRQLRKGSIQKAYRALLSYIMDLRTHFNQSGSAVSGLYHGYMDMTYFALVPASLKPRRLKIPIVFNYDAFRFEVWLSGGNRNVQQRYWELFKDGSWPDYRVIPQQGTWVDSILECDLATDFHLDDPEALTATIEAGTFAFIDDVERFLADYKL